MSWHYVHDTEDEDGNREQWKFFYKRFSAREMSAYTDAITSITTDDNEPNQTMIDMANMSIRRTERNGVPYEVDYEDWPHDVLDEAVSNHTTFRGLIDRARKLPTAKGTGSE